MPRTLAPSVLSILLGAGGAAGQDSTRVVPGWGVDTTAVAAWSDTEWQAAVPEIFRAWRAYLRSGAHGSTPTPLWSAAEQRAWPSYDLTAGVTYQGVPATVLDIRPARPGATDEYVVKTLFATAVGPERDVRPMALTRVYAVRENGRWVFANALRRLTRDWQRETVGPITFVIAPGRRFDRARALRAVQFADSLAGAFGVPRIEALTYYVASSPEELHRAMGIDWTFGSLGYGYAIRADRLILSGDSVFGEENRHELTHYVVTPLTSPGHGHPLVGEGVATWLGGTMGRDFRETMREYAAFLRGRPGITLDSLLVGQGPDLGTRPGGAALLYMVHERGGVQAVKALLDTKRGDDALKATLVRLLGVPWTEIGARWRQTVLAFGGGP